MNFASLLTSLNLAANPVETVEGYRQIIANFVPQLVSLDDRAFSDSERVKLSDFDIDAAILKHHEQHRQDLPRSDSATYLRVAGPNEINSPRQLTYSSSSASLNGLPIDSSLNEDSGSRLTHGTDIVFAGNVSSALRRHRNEAETGDLRSSTGGSSEEYASPVVSRPSSSQGLPDRPKTPARRISITDTLDRARELDTQKLKSRDAILNELKSWQLDSVGTSQVGVSRDTDKALHTQSNEVLSHSTSRRKGSVDGIRGHEITTLGARARIERRPNTSAGVLRNGSTVREAFVESTTGKSIRPTSRGGSSGQRSSSQDVDIRILDGGDDSKRPCSPTKTPRGIFTTASSSKGALGRNHEWNLEVLSPKVDITTAKRHLPSSLTSKQQLERSQRRSSEKRADEDTSSDSDADDESSVCPAVATEFGSPTLVPKTAFFNVAESLNAIEKWRDKMEYDAEDTAILSIASLQQSCLSPRGIAEPERINMTITIPDGGNAGSGNQQHSPTRQHPQEQKLALGPGNHESEHHNVKLLKEKNSQLKTRDGFRSYFRGIEQGRLEGILRQAFADHDKVQRRMHLMSGYFRHELQC
ncbi:unnamed protein product [Phytophthora lilii]|uniref:Unnamed protein product n=1 Tax=Phytophthora lilii TaxID=2077276 RepID=A0A9W6XEU3_9STRA|nr:unnamed protein product [Phytophthora lilii]